MKRSRKITDKDIQKFIMGIIEFRPNSIILITTQDTIDNFAYKPFLNRCFIVKTPEEK